MGGMAIGSWLCGQLSPRWKNLLLGYALVEGIIGVIALFFHQGFDQLLQLGYGTIMPWLSNGRQQRY